MGGAEGELKLRSLKGDRITPKVTHGREEVGPLSHGLGCEAPVQG
jgi:hypothetical protein